MSSKWDQHPLDRTQRILQTWASGDTGAVETSPAALRQAIADADWDTVERHGGLDAVVDKIDRAEEDRSTISASGGHADAVVLVSRLKRGGCARR